jgi:prephenate dehydrogenase
MEAQQDFPHFLAGQDDDEPHRWGRGKTIGIIGGMGQMGRLFGRFFEAQGYQVVVADRSAGKDNAAVIRMSDIVLFAVPLHETVNIIGELIPYARPEQLLMDLSSLKVGPIQAMLRSSSSIVGLHPMFGGNISSFAGQTMVACPARIDSQDWSYLRRLFENQGIRIKECTPEKHDYMMSIIQVLFHVTTMLTGRVLRELQVDVAETMEFTSPSYRLEMNLLGRIFAQNPALYSAITQMNPFALDVLEHLESGLKRYREWYGAGDLFAFVSDFKRTAEHLGDFCGLAFEESSALLDFSVELARAKTEDRSQKTGVRSQETEVRRQK